MAGHRRTADDNERITMNDNLTPPAPWTPILAPGRHARTVYDLDEIPTDPAIDTEPECCS